MVNMQLVQFIKDNLRKGYTYQQIRAYLVKNRWPYYIVDEAINHVYKESVQQAYDSRKPTSSLLKNLLFAGTFILVIIAGLFVLFTLFGGSSDPVNAKPSAMSFRMNLEETRLPSEGTLTIHNRISSSESLTGEIIMPTYRITNSETGALVLTWQTERGISVQSPQAVTKKLPATISPGRYTLEGRVYFKGSHLTHTINFFVYKDSAEPTCDDGIQNQGEEGIDCGGPCPPCPTCNDGKKNCHTMPDGSLLCEEGIDCGGPCPPCKRECRDCDDYNPCTRNLCVDGACVYEPIFPCCGNFLCEEELGETPENCPADCYDDSEKPVEVMTKSEILDKAKALVALDQRQAGDFCDSVPDPAIRDECFRILSDTSGNVNFCHSIGSISRRDSCYVNHAMNQRDYSVCSSIQNPYLKQSCETLKKIPMD